LSQSVTCDTLIWWPLHHKAFKINPEACERQVSLIFRGIAPNSILDHLAESVAVPNWTKYEEVAAYLLNQFADEFGLDRVEGKQKVHGDRSDIDWEIDAKGVKTDDGGFMIVECRRYTKSRQTQEQMGGLAYRILDSGAEGAIVVSPLGLQSGAEKVAQAENIFDVRLTPESTVDQFALEFLKKFIVGATTTMFMSGKASAVIDSTEDKG
jgi:hypothetical protein